ncbi:MAG: response regulator [Candidatus Gribaldobacteria bacterium]|nr:response regulator [Candidatus Gribaldobacteria bacterium]
MKTILLIEDEAALQKTMGDALGGAGYRVLQALDGEAGLRLALSEKPDLIMLDLIMPHKTGFEVLAELKQNSAIKNLPVIVLTNLESMNDIEKALAAGAVTYLVKANYSLQDVLNKIEQAIKN